MSIDKFINLLLNGTLVFTVGYRKLKYFHVDKRLRKQSQIRAAIKTKHANVSFCFTRIRESLHQTLFFTKLEMIFSVLVRKSQLYNLALPPKAMVRWQLMFSHFSNNLSKLITQTHLDFATMGDFIFKRPLSKPPCFCLIQIMFTHCTI